MRSRRSENDHPKRILIVEPNSAGHRLHYVRLIAQRAIQLGLNFRVALAPGVGGTDEYLVHLSDLNLGQILTAHSVELSELKSLARENSAELVIVPDGDGVALALGSGARWECKAHLSLLAMRATAQASTMPILTAFRKTARIALLTSASIRPRVRVTVLRSSWAPSRRTIRTVGDPITMSASIRHRTVLRESQGLDPHRYWFGVLGAVTERKNTDLVAQALLSQPPRSVGLLVAGRIQPSVLNQLEAMSPQISKANIAITVIDRLLTDVELDELVVACDCVVLAHSNEGPSGLFGKALAAGTRVLAAGARSLRADARAVPNNASWVPLSVEALSKGMAQAQRSRRPQPIEVSDAAAFADALLRTSER